MEEQAIRRERSIPPSEAAPRQRKIEATWGPQRRCVFGARKHSERARHCQNGKASEEDRFFKAAASSIIKEEELTRLPALIDPHVHFRTPGEEHKENWESAARAAVAGGVTTVLDMPNNYPSCLSLERLQEKRQLIDAQLHNVGIPLRYGLYLGADESHLNEVPKAAKEVVGVKIYMGSSTGDLLMRSLEKIEEAFAQAAKENLLVAVHAEDEVEIEKRRRLHTGADPALHSKIRTPEVAASAVAFALSLAKKYGVRLYIAHVSSREELALIRQAKQEGVCVYAEATPHHLFLDTSAYKTLGPFALVNPPLRVKEDCEALWEALHDGTIDLIGTDHAPHTVDEKAQESRAPSGFPSIEIYLALLLNAHHEKKLSLSQIVSLTSSRPREIFGLPPHDDYVLVDLHQKRRIENRNLKTRARWTPFAGWDLCGWPIYTILKGNVYACADL